MADNKTNAEPGWRIMNDNQIHPEGIQPPMTEVERLRADNERLKTMSTVEMMCENLNVNAHVRDWETRCLKAEDKVADLTRRLAEAKAIAQHNDPMMFKAAQEDDEERACLRAKVVELERLYRLRGLALFRPCLNCGYEPQKITLADGSQEEEETNI